MIFTKILALFASFLPFFVHQSVFDFSQQCLDRITQNFRSILWFPILQWRNKTFCKFWYFDSGKGLKLLVTIIVTGNNTWFTSFCFLSWFRKNEMWRNKIFQLNIKSWHRYDGLLQPIMFPIVYCTVLSYFQSQTLL